jgi:hypothetical protein
MANLQIKDGAGATKYIKGSGAGTDIDPFAPEQTVNLGATDNAVLDAILAALPAALAANGGLKVEGVAGGVAQPVSGTVTANLSATDNAVLDTIDAVLDTIDAVLDAINAKLVTGTVIGDVNLGATDNAVLDAILAALPAALAANGGLKVEGVAGGIAQPVSGTVTANLSATDNAVLDAILAALPAALAANGGLKVEGVAGGIAQPVSGTVTANLSAVDNAVLDAIQTAIEAVQAVVEDTDPSPVSSGADVSHLYDGATALTPKFAVIHCNTSGNNTIVSAVADKKIRVVQVLLVAAGTVTARFESGADGTALSGQMALVANTGFTLPFSPMGWFETASNTLLNLELSAAVYADGVIGYVEV